jgi:hypothetical protein
MCRQQRQQELGSDRLLLPSPQPHHEPAGEHRCGHDDGTTEQRQLSAPTEESVRGRTGRCVEEVGGGAVDAQGEGGQPVGDEVDPQELHRQQGDDEVRQQEDATEHDQDLADVAGEKVGDHADEIAPDPTPLDDRGYEGPGLRR